MALIRQGLSVLGVTLVAGSLLAAGRPAAVGIATSESDFRTGSAVVKGQATLFEGDGVQSLELGTRIRLQDGSRYVLGVGSSGTVHRGLVRLQSGSVELLNSGRVIASKMTVAADDPKAAASIYASGEDTVMVLVRRGAVKVWSSPAGAARLVRAGESVALKAGTKGEAKVIEPTAALAELNRVQSEQMAHLSELSRSYTCMEPTVRNLSTAFAGLSAQIATNQASRSAIQAKISRGSATPLDLQEMNELNRATRGLQQASIGLSADLDGAVFQFHHPGPPPANGSEHTTHGHTHPAHHGEHGHSVGPSGGDHQTPPHCYGDPNNPPCVVGT